MIDGATSIDDVSILRKSLGNKWLSRRNFILGYFLETDVIFPSWSNIVHDTYKSFGGIGFKLEICDGVSGGVKDAVGSYE
jgi:hypothetical protein